MSNVLTRWANRAGSAPGLVGALLLLQLAVVRAFASATTERAYLFGRELHWGCWFKQRFGFPCPTCGMTRSVLLSLQGQFTEAAQLNPAGLLLVIGLVLFSLALIFLMFYRQRHTRFDAGALHRRIRLTASAYGSLLVIVLFAHWLAEIAAR
jgi:cbb3-type cytochrome oxidase subunit 3